MPMDDNPVTAALGRPLRLAVIGGGPGSFIGSMHRSAARLDGRFEIVAGAVSSNPSRSTAAAEAIGVEPSRAYPTPEALFEGEVKRDDGAEVAAIMTPNDSHHSLAVRALGVGWDVICDKPMTNTVEEATDLVEAVDRSGLVFCLTHNYSGYSLVRQARAMREAGDLGTIRLVQVEYVQGGKAAEADPDPSDGPLPWRYDPDRGGPSLVMGDIGTHAHHLVRFVTGLEVEEVAAEVGHVVPGRQVDDFAGALLRFANGARGSFWVTQTAAGVENGLRIRVSGTKASVEWNQEIPTRLLVSPVDGPARVLTPSGPDLLAPAARTGRIVAGHPEGFREAFANVYSDAAEAIVARRTGTQPDPLATWFPDHHDGLAGIRFVEAAITSSDANGAWITV